MRRVDRQCLEPAFFDYVFENAQELFLAVNNGGFPYCLPLNFARTGNIIYIHSAKEGTKLDLIRENGRVAFSMAVDVLIDRPKSSTYYKSICGLGMASVVEDMAEKRAALDIISERYNALCPRPCAEAHARRVAIIRIDILELSGKQCLSQGPGAPEAVS